MAFGLYRFRPLGTPDPTVHADRLSKLLLGTAGLAVLVILYLFIDAFIAWRRERRILRRIQRNRQRPNADFDKPPD